MPRTTCPENNSAAAAAAVAACAACKYQRRRCTADCLLAPYFPANEHRRFLNAHRLFGVRNIQKTLSSTDPELRQDAMRALIFQSEARACDPVGGCLRIVRDLELQFNSLISCLNQLHAMLLTIRQQQPMSSDTGSMLLTIRQQQPMSSDTGSMLLSGADNHMEEHCVFMEQHQQHQQHQQHDDHDDYLDYDGNGGITTSAEKGEQLAQAVDTNSESTISRQWQHHGGQNNTPPI